MVAEEEDFDENQKYKLVVREVLQFLPVCFGVDNGPFRKKVTLRLVLKIFKNKL